MNWNLEAKGRRAAGNRWASELRYVREMGCTTRSLRKQGRSNDVVGFASTLECLEWTISCFGIIFNPCDIVLWSTEIAKNAKCKMKNKTESHTNPPNPLTYGPSVFVRADARADGSPYLLGLQDMPEVALGGIVCSQRWLSTTLRLGWRQILYRFS